MVSALAPREERPPRAVSAPAALGQAGIEVEVALELKRPRISTDRHQKSHSFSTHLEHFPLKLMSISAPRGLRVQPGARGDVPEAAQEARAGLSGGPPRPKGAPREALPALRVAAKGRFSGLSWPLKGLFEAF